MSNRKLKILQVVSSLQVGGLETVAMNCMRYSDPTKYDFDFLLLSNDSSGEFLNEAKAHNCRIFHIDAPKRNYVKLYRNIQKHITEFGPYDIVHSHVYFTSGLVLMAAKKAGVSRCIAHSHSIQRANDNKPVRKVYYALMRHLLLRYVDRFAACSVQAGNYLFGDRNFSEKGIVIPNSIDIRRFQFNPSSRMKIREELGIPGERIVVGQVAHLSPAKNQEFLIELFASFLNLVPNAVLLLIGDGELRQVLQDKIAQLDISSHVRMTGSRMDVPELLSAMDIALVTSLHEGFGLTIIEAMANGLPCIAERHAIVDELHQYSSHLSLIDGFDKDKWNSTIQHVLMNRNQNRQTCPHNLNRYDIEYFQQAINSLYSL